LSAENGGANSNDLFFQATPSLGAISKHAMATLSGQGIVVHTGAALELASHFHRSDTGFVVQGTGV